MPKVSVWLIRTALVHVLSGAVLGAFYFSFKAVGWPLFALSHRPVHVEQMLIGWMVQLVIGVAFWILPRPEGHDPSAHGGLMWTVYGLLNGGLLAAALGGDPSLPAALAVAGRVAEAAAVMLFGLHAWNRQRPYRAAARRLIL
jgi:hypothetical protein